MNESESGVFYVVMTHDVLTKSGAGDEAYQRRSAQPPAATGQD